jgi:hypothetical protein
MFPVKHPGETLSSDRRTVRTHNRSFPCPFLKGGSLGGVEAIEIFFRANRPEGKGEGRRSKEGENLGVTPKKMLFEPVNPWILRALPEGCEPQEPVEAGHMEGEERKGFFRIIRFISKGEGLPADAILGTVKKDLISLGCHHRKKPVGTHQTKGREDPCDRGDQGAKRVREMKLAKGEMEGEKKKKDAKRINDPPPERRRGTRNDSS